MYHCAVDKENQIIDFFLSPTRNTQAAQPFLGKEIENSGKPEKFNMDKRLANLVGLEQVNQSLPEDQKVEIRQIK